MNHTAPTKDKQTQVQHGRVHKMTRTTRKPSLVVAPTTLAQKT